jgi:beta-lactamase class A
MDRTRLDIVADFMQRRLSRRRATAYGSAGLAAILTGLELPAASKAQESATPTTSGADWDAFGAQLAAVSPETAVLAAELIYGEIVPIFSQNPDDVLAVGSSFKLWILGTLAKQVEAGVLDWEQPLEIEDKYRSVPGGDMRYVKAGTVFSMRYVAEKMMQKSDNTATDHLLFLAGRENVEQTMVEMGVADPDRNIPLFSTREMVMLKFASTPEAVDAYFAADVAERRRILAEEIAAIPYEALADLDQTAPLEIERIEWFATRNDLARTMAWLNATREIDALRQVREIMSLDTPVAFDGEIWPYIGYKGGSEMGVLSATWLLDRADGRTFIYSAGFRDLDAAIDMSLAVPALDAGRDLLSVTP